MSSCSSCSEVSMVLVVSLFVTSLMAMTASAGNFYQDFDITFGDERAKILNGGQLLTLNLDKFSGSGFRSKNEYLLGRIDMQIKLVSGNSAGTVTAYYLSSQGPTHDEIDFEFLGNLSGDPYTLHTNVFSQGKGNREQQFHLWFDPTKAFHTYSIVWNSQRIIFLVDNIPIRVFNNLETIGVPFPKNQPMRIYSSLWNADDWATRGGLVKTDWTQAPFTASYRNFKVSTTTSTSTNSLTEQSAWQTQGLDAAGRNRLRWVQQKFMVYNYCSDLKRFPQGLPLCPQPHQIQMSSSSDISMISMVLVVSLFVTSLMAMTASAGNFYQDFDITFGGERAKILNGGQLLTLNLDKFSGSGFKSKNEYLFGRIDMQIKLVSGNSAGTVTAYYLSSQGPTHDEIDFEFLGNLSGDPYTLHTNVFSQGKGNREQQFHLWFDPTKAFHTYSIVWNSQRIIFLVDNIPIRVFHNLETIGVPFPKNQPMRIYSSLWNADDWATRGGLVKTDWTQAPFTASYRNFQASTTSTNSLTEQNAWQTQGLDAAGRNRLRWVQQKFMVYNYCSDLKRFPQGLPAECRRSRF
ncbi:hypothetical protein ACE6H2_011311 [Prunus campanulata]